MPLTPRRTSGPDVSNAEMRGGTTATAGDVGTTKTRRTLCELVKEEMFAWIVTAVVLSRFRRIGSEGRRDSATFPGHLLRTPTLKQLPNRTTLDTLQAGMCQAAIGCESQAQEEKAET
ncbi:hypothetical protein DPEC_G00244850 [Dallia pectoralis]|uniref:Uncharacterized protein n=1 Tax=Dallia pectoralis TaxID=75939 RepID=A0ACC2FVU9_DALPE|nr:hypothetical protein DPEC_G00244850 [Dallia pectoralis]